MIVILKNNSSKKNIKNLIDSLITNGFSITWMNHDTFKISGNISVLNEEFFKEYPCVKDIQKVDLPYKYVSRNYKKEDTIIDVNGIKIGGKGNIVIIAGPCSIESKEQVLDIAEHVKKSGAKILRGGAYKLRTSPYSFQGLGKKGLNILLETKKITGLPIISEIVSINQIKDFEKQVDIIQVGARNMQNYELLKELGKINKPILLKRGLANTIEEWLLAAEYIMSYGNSNVILCERGIRTFETYTRYTLDLSVISIVKQISHLPIIIDPSHATGRWDLVESMSLAAIAAGADGLLIEVHNNPELALSDGNQSLKYDHFDELVKKGRLIAKIVGRDIW